MPPTPPEIPIPLPFHENWARDVMARRPGTASDLLPLVIWRDTEGENGSQFANHHHDFYSLYLIRSGRGTHVIDHAGYGVSRGDVYVMGPHMTHYFAPGCSHLTADTIHFTLDVFEPTTLAALRETPGFTALFVPKGGASGRRWLHLTPAAYAETNLVVRELYAEWKTGTVLGAALTRAHFLRLLVSLARHETAFRKTGKAVALQTATPHGEAVVAQAVRFMDAQFARPLRIEEVASQVFLSPDRFTHIFTQNMGRTPRDYLRHLRVERAKTLLTTTGASLGEVARLSGFNEAAYLSRVLRAETGLTPRQLRLQSATQG